MPDLLETIPPGPKKRIPAEDLYRGGYGPEILSVIPPAPIGRLHPDSKIKPESMGKAPGKRQDGGVWTGISDWANRETTLDEAREMDRTEANVGLKARLFPSFDVDVEHPTPAGVIEGVIRKLYPNVAQRIGCPPKALFPFRLKEGATPFKKKVLPFVFAGGRHKVEVLGDGQQYVVSGFHPKTGRQYHWPAGCPKAAALPEINEEEADGVLEAVRVALVGIGADCEPVTGGGERSDKPTVDQESLKAPNMDLLRRAVEAIPNRQETDRGFYVDMCAAIRAATMGSEGDGLMMWMAWAEKWPDPRANQETDMDTWESLRPPFRIGAGWIFDKAREHDATLAVDAAREEFPVVPTAVEPAPGTARLTDPGGELSLIPLMSPDHFNDDGNAERFVRLHGKDVRYCIEKKCWFVWDGRRWGMDEGPAVERRAIAAMLEFLKQAAGHPDNRDRLLKFAVESRNARRIQALLIMAKSKTAISHGEFDTNPYLLNFENGTLDVRTGVLGTHNRGDLITKIVHCKYNPEAKCPRFLAFLHWAFDGSAAMIGYLQRAFGCTMTAGVKERVFFVCYGPSSSGKTTTLQAVRRAFDEYTVSINMGSLMARDGHESANAQSDLSDLSGARYAMTTETEKGVRFNESLLKRLIPGSGTVLKGFRKYENGKPFVATHTFWFDGNHLPTVRDGEGVFSRFREIRFNNSISEEERDTNLGEKLDSEREGLVAWVVAGARDWLQRGKLDEPEEVKRAGAEYKESQDSVAQWAARFLVKDPEGKTAFKDLWNSYERFCATERRSGIGSLQLPDRLRALGFKPVRLAAGRGWGGVRLSGDEFGVVDEAGGPDGYDGIL